MRVCHFSKVSNLGQSGCSIPCCHFCPSIRVSKVLARKQKPRAFWLSLRGNKTRRVRKSLVESGIAIPLICGSLAVSTEDYKRCMNLCKRRPQKPVRSNLTPRGFLTLFSWLNQANGWPYMVLDSVKIA
ncbi:hypothetical protein LX36DRAFT_116004 [Colletotrichum falcatum]|nr:hypothetical protein LX36DRAFT_116004 [Colletotrichum falcatum]